LSKILQSLFGMIPARQDYCQNLAPVVEEGYGTLYSAVRGPGRNEGGEGSQQDDDEESHPHNIKHPLNNPKYVEIPY